MISALLLAVACTGPGQGVRGTHPPQRSITAPSTSIQIQVAAPTATNGIRVVARIPIPNPVDVAISGHAVWVRSVGFGPSLWKIDPATRRIEQRIDTGPSGVVSIPSLAVAFRSVWVLDSDGTVVRVSEDTGNVLARIPIGQNASAISAGFGSVWTTTDPVRNGRGGALHRIDPASNRVVARVALPGTPVSLTVGVGGVWVLDVRSLLHVSPRTNSVVSRTRLPSRSPSLLASGSDGIWVANRDRSGSIDEVNPRTGRVVATRPFAWLLGEGNGLGALMGVAVENGIVWANSGDVRGMDVMSGQVFADVPVGEAVDTTAGIAARDGAIWAVGPADRQIVELRPLIPDCRKRTAGFAPAVSPAEGRPGTGVTVRGRTPYTTKGGQYRPGEVTEVQLWWNVHAWAYTSVLPGFHPRAAGPGPVELVGDVGTLGMCTYRTTFRVPDVPVGRYPVSGIEFGGGGAAGLGATLFKVTR